MRHNSAKVRWLGRRSRTFFNQSGASQLREGARWLGRGRRTFSHQSFASLLRGRAHRLGRRSPRVAPGATLRTWLVRRRHFTPSNLPEAAPGPVRQQGPSLLPQELQAATHTAPHGGSKLLLWLVLAVVNLRFA
ncbi:hypothetical protein NDU88_000299 [Pleurodeles waltl]|uniref:Uncharacterized protein n=1 Tax=Pleurodeles waltl TaxID=8319 RepID=A0AAV7SW50_PLEWA|nr:hypothetical protein NDU88_000299 [Pleurodeles waltl]